VKTLHTAYRVTDLAVSLDFYSALGYQELGRVDMGEGASLTMLKFPGQEVVALELVHRPADGRVQVSTGFSHLGVEALAGDLARTDKSGVARHALGSHPPDSLLRAFRSSGLAHFPGRTDRDRRADLGRRTRDHDLGRIRDRGEWRRQP
jgi:catechol 2,3-dioxygenase-like lactoylglutathione lyase family enzyme